MTRAFPFAVLAFALSACSTLDAAPAGPVTERYQPQAPLAWSLTFSDPALAALLKQADTQSLDVKIALARLAEANQAVALAGAEQGPVVTLDAAAAAGGRRFRNATTAGGGALSGGIEIDLWGRLAHAREAAATDALAAAADAQSARLLIAAEVTHAYLDLRAAQATTVQLQAKSELAARAGRLTEALVREGRATPSELGARRQAQTAAEHALAAGANDIQRQRWRLAALLGSATAIDVPPAAAIFSVPAIGAVAADLATNRPDVEAAFARLQAADARRAEAVAAARPRFMLIASLGGADPSVVSLFDVTSLAWAVAAGLTGALFDNGASEARIAAAASEADIADLEYRRAVVTAWTEEQQAILALADAEANAVVMAAAETQAKLDRARGDKRHAEGLADGLDIIDLQDRALDAAFAAETARAGHAHALTSLVLACGGVTP